MQSLPSRHRLGFVCQSIHRMIHFGKWLAGCLMAALFLTGCADKKTDGKENADSLTALTDPRRPKVQATCGSCHLFVEPGLLDKTTWAKSVLPAMGTRLGIFTHNGVHYTSDSGKINTDGIFPKRPVLTKEEWQKILDYFEAYAPVSVAPQTRTQAYSVGLPMFQARTVGGNTSAPIISMVKTNPAGGYFFYDAGSGNLVQMTKEGNKKAGGILPNPISSMTPYRNGFLVSKVGSLYPSDEWLGAISYIEPSGNQLVEKEIIRNQVERPVQLQTGDLDGDGTEDIVVCGFGNNKGDFYWLKKEGARWKKHSIRNVPGAISARLTDFDKDGDLDIITLFAQGLEKLILFTNNGKGEFTQKALLEFPAVQGSSSFELDDFNKDGILDILYTCGDNADYSVVFKNYHGVYIFLGKADGSFTQTYFYPMNGAYKAMARDFDGDGDLDIAAISFFADYVNQPFEGFLFFEQTQPLQFTVRSHSATHSGRWLTMDVGDMDGDQDPDIVLGNFSYGPTSSPDSVNIKWQRGPVTMVLENLGK